MPDSSTRRKAIWHAQQDYDAQLMMVEHGNRRRPVRRREEVTIDDPSATADQTAKRKKLEQSPMQVDMKYLDKRWNSVGQTYYTETTVPVEQNGGANKVSWWSQHAL